MYTHFFKETIVYTGSELRPHWVAERTGVYDNVLAVFCGPCRVETAELVDLEDRASQSRIEAAQMLHFIGESFDNNLDQAILEHRLLICTFVDQLRKSLSPADAARITRRGNDLFVSDPSGPRKLSVGIVTASPVSTLFHFGVNIDESGAPVAAFGLRHFGINIQEFVTAFLLVWETELASLRRARCKVAAR
jgi:hypothetical protein